MRMKSQVRSFLHSHRRSVHAQRKPPQHNLTHSLFFFFAFLYTCTTVLATKYVTPLCTTRTRAGFDKGAIVPHREMVLILDQALKDTERARKEAVQKKKYKDAARYSAVQKVMRVQFRERQQAQLSLTDSGSLGVCHSLAR